MAKFKRPKGSGGTRLPRGGGIPGMGGGGMGNLMSQMQKLQEDMERVQGELAETNVESSSGGGMVTVVATGDQKIVSITIQKEAVDPDDVDMLQDLVLAAVNDALDKSRALQEERMGGLTGGLGLPGLGL
jgi:DNA-binding YbaB/EbfC family protein